MYGHNFGSGLLPRVLLHCAYYFRCSSNQDQAENWCPGFNTSCLVVNIKKQYNLFRWFSELEANCNDMEQNVSCRDNKSKWKTVNSAGYCCTGTIINDTLLNDKPHMYSYTKQSNGKCPEPASFVTIFYQYSQVYYNPGSKTRLGEMLIDPLRHKQKTQML